MHLAIVGSGYVGLVTGTCLARCGHHVTCIDKNASHIAALNEGRVPIYEPGLDQLIAESRAAGRLRFTTDLTAGIGRAQAVFIAVGTPPHGRDGRADLTFVHEAARAIAAAISGYKVVVVKSTVPVGTGDAIEAIIGGIQPGHAFSVVSNPEFLREGAAIDDFMNPTRVVIGANDAAARQMLAEIYRPLGLADETLFFTGRRSAELIKYASNAFLATKVTFINEIADLCETVDADVGDVAHGMGLDPRIGPKFLQPGPGLGGSCFPKGVAALADTARRSGTRLELVDAVIAANNRRKALLAERVVDALGGSAKDAKVGVLGLAFKAGTDDMREAPALVLVPALQAAGAFLRAFDPQAMSHARRLLPGLDLAADPYACAEGADVLVVLTEWDIFRRLDLPRLREAMRTPTMVDFRNLYDAGKMAALGFSYYAVGRSSPARQAMPLPIRALA